MMEKSVAGLERLYYSRDTISRVPSRGFFEICEICRLTSG